MRALSLFSGIGGIDLACEWASIETAAFCEREPFCQKVLKKHWPNVPIYDDVCTLTKARLEEDGIGTIDLIHGGYPCQPFSHAGKRRGTEDDRHLWPEVKRILEEVRPRWFLGENVAGHVTLGLDDVLSELGGAGYSAQAFLIPAASVGAMHKRERVFILGYTKCGGCSGEPRGRPREEPEDRYSKLEKGVMADSANAIINRVWEKQSAGRTGFANGCETLANSESKRCRETRETCERSEEWTAGGNALGDTNGNQLQREQFIWIRTMERRNQERKYQRSSDGTGKQRSTQSRVGGNIDEFSRWLDRGLNPLDALTEFIAKYPQPAPMGMEQYDWEPRRVAVGIKNRAPRLKALGNAVDPLQILPIVYAIKQINDLLEG